MSEFHSDTRLGRPSTSLEELVGQTAGTRQPGFLTYTREYFGNERTKQNYMIQGGASAIGLGTALMYIGLGYVGAAVSVPVAVVGGIFTGIGLLLGYFGFRRMRRYDAQAHQRIADRPYV